MGSVGNRNPWAPYDSYKDCSQGICSIYCPQWCYIVFPPPPPFTLVDDDSAGTDLSPLIIAVIGILASAFILVSYYTLISKYCRRRNQLDTALELNENHSQATTEAWQGATPGLDDTIIRSITVCKYKKGDGLIEGTDCSVCLSEFQESESLRLLPKCNHAFHLPCIDRWLKSHASCPLCRASVAPGSNNLLPQGPIAPPTQEAPQNATTVVANVSTLDQYQHRILEAVSVIQDLECGFRQVGIINNLLVVDGVLKNSSDHRDLDCASIRQDQVQPTRRSASSSCSSSSQVSVSFADILGNSQYDGDDDEQLLRDGEKSKSGILSGLVRSPLAMKRSISTGRLMMSTTTRHEKGRSSAIPN